MPRTRRFDFLKLGQGDTGGSTATPGDEAAALASVTPVIVIGGLTDPRGDAGAMSSRGSTKRAIGRGWKPAPKPAPPDEVLLPQKLAGYVRWLYEHEAIEVIVFAGGAELVVGETRVELNPGRWIVAQVEGPSTGSGLPVNVAFSVPKFEVPEGRRQAAEGGER